MEFFCYHRDRPGSMALRDELLEEHWRYMDEYAAQMIARGPTLAADLTVPSDQEALIAFGPLLSDDCNRWLGTAALVRATDPDAARAVLTAGRYAASRSIAGSSAGGHEPKHRDCDWSNRRSRRDIAVGQHRRGEFVRGVDGIRAARLMREDLLVTSLVRRTCDRVAGGRTCRGPG